MSLSKYFTEKEFACPCCGNANVDPELVGALDLIREWCGFPLTINSAKRCAKHNAEVGGAPNSAHVLGKAADIACTDPAKRFLILKFALNFGINRIEWGTKTWIHIDVADESTGHTRFVIFLP